MKKPLPAMLSLFALAAAYLLVRYPLFRLHGMKEWPLILLAVGVGVLVVSAVFRKGRIVLILTPVGYAAGFLAGCLFGGAYGPPEAGLNSCWIVWTAVFAACVLAGIAADLVRGKKEGR